MTLGMKFMGVSALVVVVALGFSSVEAAECKTTQLGHEYSGTLSKTVSERHCQDWASQSPQTHEKWSKFPEGSEEAAKNYCRNPDDSPDGPWCYTTDPSKRWEYCDIPICKAVECKKTQLGEEYSGVIASTATGRFCQDWASQSPQTHDKWTKFPEGSEEAAKNYCRNPDDSPDGPWCYTTDPSTRWEYCNVQFCAECKTTQLGHEYSGSLSKTVSERHCQDWASQSPQTHEKWTKFPEGSEEAAKNYCRNPDDSPDGPWCYTTDPSKRWEYCDIKNCEIAECKTTQQGHEYSGVAATTLNGLTCQDWASQSPQTHDKWTKFPEGSEEAAKNYCRNPDDSPDGPWCYTTDPSTRWEYCDIKNCENLECKTTQLGEEYSGITSKTVNGRFCQDWASQSPQTHEKWTKFPEGSEEAAKNYCRNPDDSPDGPWCYTTDPSKRWEYCDIKSC